MSNFAQHFGAEISACLPYSAFLKRREHNHIKERVAILEEEK